MSADCKIWKSAPCIHTFCGFHITEIGLEWVLFGSIVKIPACAGGCKHFIFSISGVEPLLPVHCRLVAAVLLCWVVAAVCPVQLTPAWPWHRSVVIRWCPGKHTPASPHHTEDTQDTGDTACHRPACSECCDSYDGPCRCWPGRARGGRRGAESFLIRSYLAPGYICPLHCNGRGQADTGLTRPPPR